MSKGITPEKAEEIRLARGIGKGTKLRVLRVQRGFSQAQLAEKSGVPMRTLQKYENNITPINGAKLSTICQLCSALDCKITDILEDEDLIEKFNQVK